MVCCIGELLNERWDAFDGEIFEKMIKMLIDHLRIQYTKGLNNVVGSDVRVRIFEALLLIQMNPITQQLSKILFSFYNNLKGFIYYI